MFQAKSIAENAGSGCEVLAVTLTCRYICVSFVQKGQDLQELIDIMDSRHTTGIPSRSGRSRR